MKAALGHPLPFAMASRMALFFSRARTDRHVTIGMGRHGVAVSASGRVKLPLSKAALEEKTRTSLRPTKTPQSLPFLS